MAHVQAAKELGRSGSGREKGLGWSGGRKGVDTDTAELHNVWKLSPIETSLLVLYSSVCVCVLTLDKLHGVQSGATLCEVVHVHVCARVHGTTRSRLRCWEQGPCVCVRV